MDFTVATMRDATCFSRLMSGKAFIYKTLAAKFCTTELSPRSVLQLSVSASSKNAMKCLWMLFRQLASERFWPRVSAEFQISPSNSRKRR